MAKEQMDVKRPRQKVKREIRRSNIALDEYLFDRKMQSLYYGKKPVSDDTPAVLQFIKNLPKKLKQTPALFKKTFATGSGLAKKYPAYTITAGLVLCLVVLFGAAVLLKQSKPSAGQSGNNGGTQAPATAAASQPVQSSRIPLHQSPEFPVVLPQGKSIDDFGGWAKVSPPGGPSAYAYKDKIGTVDLLVSEQLLPDSFKTDTSAQVQKLAVGFNANQSVKTEKVEFFVGTNETGEQSVIAYTKTLLIFLKSSAKMPNARWQTYIEDLK